MANLILIETMVVHSKIEKVFYLQKIKVIIKNTYTPLLEFMDLVFKELLLGKVVNIIILQTIIELLLNLNGEAT